MTPRFLQFCLYASVAAILAACAADPAAQTIGEPPTILTLDISAAEQLNPDVDGRPSPLVARIYELSSVDLFSTADFFAIYDNDLTLLANDIKFRKELYLRPGESHAMTLETSPQSRYFAVFAAYRDLDVAQWKAVMELRRQQTTPVTIHFGSTAVDIRIEPSDSD